MRIVVQIGVTVGILVALILILNPGQLGQDIAGSLTSSPRPPRFGSPVAAPTLAKGMRIASVLRQLRGRRSPPARRCCQRGTRGLRPAALRGAARADTSAGHAPPPRPAPPPPRPTVQELLYTTVIVAVAIPGALAYAAGISGIAVSLAGILAILAILTIHPVFQAVLRLVRRIPVARRATSQLEVLHLQTVRLLRRPGTWLWLTLSVLGALFELTLFWLVVRGTSGVPVPWVTTTFIYGAAYLTGAATSPGAGWLREHRHRPAPDPGGGGSAAVAGVLIMRAADKGVITLAGFTAWFWVRRHLRRRQGLLLGGDEPVPAQEQPAAPRPVALPRPVMAALPLRTEALASPRTASAGPGLP